MALFKCKMCGGSLEVAEGEAIAECQYCGASQTLPKTNDENIQGLFNRANLLRRKCEFDKAEEIYERIIEADEGEAEAYWGVILCKFGIEYVEDPKSFKRIPTCHRTSYDSIASDEYYKKALEYAELGSRSLYEAEAKEIDRLQREILAISKREEPYDVFICYKETDESGKRTQDSVIANDIYYQLTNEGYKVFYAAITLEDKLGQAYEPIIFAALNSAKVMLAIGTRPEYFGAVWVKNEWSRFLKMMKSDRSKLLIPCYRDMDAYELPEEFAHLQAQDMSKIGFINDIVRGIKKVLTDSAPGQKVIKETVIAGAQGAAEPLLKRAELALEDGDFSAADGFCEQALNIDPELGAAYLYKLMAELGVRARAELKNCKEPFDGNKNCQKAIRFGGEALAKELSECIEYIKERNEKERIEAAYSAAAGKMRSAKSESDYMEAAQMLKAIHGYRDAEALVAECEEKAKTLRNDGIYNRAVSLMSCNSVKACEDAIELFRSIPEWRDSQEKITACEERMDLIKRENEEKARKEAEERALRERERERKAEEKAKKAKKIKLIAIISAAIAAIAILLVVLFTVIIPIAKYGILLQPGATEIKDEEFMYRRDLTSVTIPDSVTSIGVFAFYGCSSLTNITIPDSVTSIEAFAFYGCSSLTSITIPDSVTSIGERTFQGCSSLTSITIPDSVTSIGDSAFGYCSSLTSITIPDSVTSIGEGAFWNCSSLTSVTIGNSVTSIGEYAFDGCSSLTSITIPDSVTSIGEGAFSGCSSLTSVVIGNGVTSIGESAFEGCSKLTDVYYTGTEAEWRNINIRGYGNSDLTGANIHYNCVIPEE